jgi:hypothetical protein
VTGRCRKLLDGLNEKRVYSHLNEEVLDRTTWRSPFGRGFGPVVWHDYGMNEWMNAVWLTLFFFDKKITGGLRTCKFLTRETSEIDKGVTGYTILLYLQSIFALCYVYNTNSAIVMLVSIREIVSKLLLCTKCLFLCWSADTVAHMRSLCFTLVTEGSYKLCFMCTTDHYSDNDLVIFLLRTNIASPNRTERTWWQLEISIIRVDNIYWK